MTDMLRSNWIWTPDWRFEERQTPHILFFRKEFGRADHVMVSANCRYKLYINGQFVQEGPQKGCAELAYRDPAKLAPFLSGDKNTAALEVLWYPEAPALRNDSLYYSPYPCLYVEDLSEKGELNGSGGWKCTKADQIRLTGEPFSPAPIHGMEEVCGRSELRGWKTCGYDDSWWEDAKPYSVFETNRPIAPFFLEERTIPPMEHVQRKFAEVVCVRDDGEKAVCFSDADSGVRAQISQWEDMLAGKAALVIPARTRQVVEISAGEEMCGYPSLRLADGAGASVYMVYAECYGIPQPPVETPVGTRPMLPKKGDRTDFKNGCLTGTTDRYRAAGFGSETEPEEYVPYLFRTFRFIRLEIETEDVPLTVLSYDYVSTGYPLAVKHVPEIADETMRRIWEISLRTLKRCMHETYVDCPFYEQLQYTMDSRAEILFTYEVSEDDRLARACMDAFRRTQRSDGILQASAPAVGVNVIPGFSIFYILMVHDHMQYFGDAALVREHFGCVDNVLRFFDSHLTEKGLVGSVGSVLFRHRYWSFIDWCREWDETIGVPTAALQGERSVTMESLLYLYGLKRAAELAAFIGRSSVAEEYRARAGRLGDAILLHCTGESGLIQDGPGLSLYSTHGQVWAILCGLVEKEQGRRMLDRTFGAEGVPQCSVSMSFYLLQALDLLGETEKMDALWEPWKRMLDNNLTTCVENGTDERSDCHAWGDIMLYAWPRIYNKKKDSKNKG